MALAMAATGLDQVVNAVLEDVYSAVGVDGSVNPTTKTASKLYNLCWQAAGGRASADELYQTAIISLWKASKCFDLSRVRTDLEGKALLEEQKRHLVMFAWQRIRSDLIRESMSLNDQQALCATKGCDRVAWANGNCKTHKDEKRPSERTYVGSKPTVTGEMLEKHYAPSAEEQALDNLFEEATDDVLEAGLTDEELLIYDVLSDKGSIRAAARALGVSRYKVEEVQKKADKALGGWYAEEEA